MTCRISQLVLALASGFAVVAVDAAVLPVEATLTLEVAAIAPQSFASTGFATVNGSGGGLHVQSLALGAGLVGGTVLQPVTDPGAAPISALWLDVSNAAGSVAETSGGTLRGAIALPGFAKICLYGVSYACSDSLANLSVPLTPIGAGGASTVQGVVNLTVYGVPWTTGTAGIGSITRMGFAHGPSSGASSTAQPDVASARARPVSASRRAAISTSPTTSTISAGSWATNWMAMYANSSTEPP